MILLKLGGVESEVHSLKDEIREFKTDMLAFKEDMREFKTDMLAFKEDMLEFKADMLVFQEETKEKFKNIDLQLLELRKMDEMIFDEVERVHEILNLHIADTSIHRTA